jgi:hypothetical protein
MPDPLPPPESGRTKWGLLGGAAGVAVYLAGMGIVLAGERDDQGYWALGALGMIVVVTVLMVIAGGIMVAFARTRAFAVGLLISIAIGVLLDSGVCLAVVRSTAA